MLNYVKAFSDFLTSFTFHHGINFQVPRAFQHITPALLERVFTKDNNKKKFLWEMGQAGSIFGDVFIKVAYQEDDYTLRRYGHGRVRLLVLNPATCFPKWHPHEPGRMEEFKLKYKFWACADPETEALTDHGWKTYDQIQPEDQLLTIDPVTDAVTWDTPSKINVFDYDGEMVRWSGRVDALTTPNHRWIGDIQRGNHNNLRYERQEILSEYVQEARKGSRLVTGGGTPLEFATIAKWDDELVETAAWYITEGCDHYNQQGYHQVFLGQKKPEGVADIRRLMAYWQSFGVTFNEYKPDKNGVISWYLGKGVNTVLEDAAPGKVITPEFLCSLTYQQAQLFRKVLLDGDGCRKRSTKWTQVEGPRRDGYQMLCAMLGIRSAVSGVKVQEYASRYSQTRHLGETREHYSGKVWCPTVRTGYFMARRNGKTYWTGNTAPDGTRYPNTYVEIITDDVIKEYINDELIRENPNPVGEIPVIHIANQISPGSPWGMSDIFEVIPINREYNEKSTEISDIINYHAAPITVVTGGTPPELEKGPAKIWGLKNDKSKVFNLEGGFQGLPGAMEYLDRLKQAMHEMVGVPVTALGQEQPISNTSGVALTIQYFHTMQKYGIKQVTYGEGLQDLARLILLHLFIKEPETLAYNPNTDGIMEEGQQPILDINDPEVYYVDLDWPPPLPVDTLIKLNELQQKLMVNLESKRGALRDLGEQFPDEKLQELFLEQKEDLVQQSAMAIIKAQVQSFIMEAFGVVPEGAEQVPPEPPGKNADGTPAQPPAPKPPSGLPDIGGLTAGMDPGLIGEIITQATLPRVPAFRNIDKNNNES